MAKDIFFAGRTVLAASTLDWPAAGRGINFCTSTIDSILSKPFGGFGSDFTFSVSLYTYPMHPQLDV